MKARKTGKRTRRCYGNRKPIKGNHCSKPPVKTGSPVKNKKPYARGKYKPSTRSYIDKCICVVKKRVKGHYRCVPKTATGKEYAPRAAACKNGVSHFVGGYKRCAARKGGCGTRARRRR